MNAAVVVRPIRFRSARGLSDLIHRRREDNLQSYSLDKFGTMARASSITDTQQQLDPTAINLSRLLSRLEQNLLSPEAENRYHSSYERAKVGANLEYARTLLLRLEHDSAGLKVQSKRQQLQTDLQTKRDQIKRLNQRLYELNQIGSAAEEEDEDSSEEDNEDSQDQTPTYAPATKASSSIDTDDTTLLQPHLRSRRPPQDPPPTSATATSTSTSARTSLFSGRRSPTTATNPSTSTSASTTTAQTETLLSHHRTEQESLTASLVAMATALKDSTSQFSASLEAEKSVVERAGEGLDKNVGGMEAAGKKIGVLRRMSEGRGWWGRMLMYAWIAGLAVVAVLLVAVGPKLRF
ncbi:hypothetical protein EV356DRAFT_515328 [Viridothelium virens]|uniref:Synaptobrevin n=1 Tax=Viridothelium virens TaxID=1048519 RepID=A0A6A6HMQ6_VIRVR|nr:hypothetical protein EV356DRAFT_515328 [Viridothelium virens]